MERFWSFLIGLALAIAIAAGWTVSVLLRATPAPVGPAQPLFTSLHLSAASVAGTAGEGNVVDGALTLRLDPGGSRLEGTAVSLSIGNIFLEELRLGLAPRPTAADPLTVTLTAGALGGRINGSLFYQPRDPGMVEVELLAEDLALSDIVARIPGFEGQLDGPANARIAFRYGLGRLVLLPSRLWLREGAEAHLSYRRPGWLSGDRETDLASLFKQRRIDQILVEPNGPQYVTEMACRDLSVSAFEARLNPSATGEEPPLRITIAGHSMVSGTRVPVELTIPVRGDLLETIELGLHLGRAREAPRRKRE